MKYARFFAAVFLSIFIAFQSSVFALGRTYTEQELRNLGIHFVQQNTTKCKADGSVTSSPDIDGSLSNTQVDTSKFTTIEQKIAQTFVVGIDPTQAATFTNIVKKYPIGGIAIIGSHDDATFNKGYFTSLGIAAGTPLLITADQEGGKVQRFDKAAAVGDQPSAKDMGAMTADQVEAIGKHTGEGLASLGVNVDLAPVLDLDNGTNSISTLGRSFSSDPNVVIQKAGAFAKGLAEGGIKPVFKHFPGHGKASGTGNSDNGIVTTPSLDILKTSDLIPYQQLVNKDSAAVMLGNLIVPGLTENAQTPTSLSPATVALLRNNYGFTGLIMTDDLHAGAITQQGISLPSAIQRSLGAGVDSPLFSFTNESDIASAIDLVKANVSADKIDAAFNHMVAFKNTQSAAAVSTTTSTPTNVSLKTGSSVYILGDSITAMSASQYTAAFQQKGITAVINSSSGRSINGPGLDGDKLTGLQAIAQDKDKIAAADAIVVALGTNAGETPTSIDTAIDAIKAAKKPTAAIYWVDTIAVGRPDYSATKTSNISIYGEAPSKGYTIISWAKKVDDKSMPAVLTGNEADLNKYILPYAAQSPADQAKSLGVHPTTSGIIALTTLVANSLQTGTTSTVATAKGCCTVAGSAASALSADGSVTATVYGAVKTLPASWVPLLVNAGRDVGVDPAFLAAILGNETNWTPPEAFIENPSLDQHGSISGPFQFDDGTAAPLTKLPELDGNKDGVVDQKNPADAAYMAAYHLKSMGAGLDTPLGDAGDYAVARDNADGKVTIRTIAAHYNQGGGWSSDNAVQGNNNVKNYMDQAMSITDTIRKSGAFANVTGSTALTSGCGTAQTSGTDATDDAQFTVYSQSDPRWANNPYGIDVASGTTGTIASSGCGPSAMAMAITFLTKQQVTPADTAAYGILHGTQDTTGGSLTSMVGIFAANWGLTSAPVAIDVNAINSALQLGGLVLLGGQGSVPYTKYGHWIVVRGVLPDGKWKIGDSNLPEDNKLEFDPASVLALTLPDHAFVVTKN